MPGDWVIWQLWQQPELRRNSETYLHINTFVHLVIADRFWSLLLQEQRREVVRDISCYEVFENDRFIEQIKGRELSAGIDRQVGRQVVGGGHFKWDSDTDSCRS